jgi:hypothetical protein
MTDETPLPCPLYGHAPLVTNKKPLYGDGWMVKCSNLCAGNLPAGKKTEIPRQTAHPAIASLTSRTPLRTGRFQHRTYCETAR